MTPTPFRRLSVPLTVLVLLTGGVFAAGDKDLERLPGYVDPAPFLALEDEDGELVSITIPGTLLKALAGPFGKESELAGLIGGLEWVGATIVGTEDPERIRKARELFDSTEKRLLREGWERLVVVREEGSTVKVLILNTEKTIAGLVVMVIDDEEIVFTNIAGVIDLEKLGALAEEMKIPGLENLGEN